MTRARRCFGMLLAASLLAFTVGAATAQSVRDKPPNPAAIPLFSGAFVPRASAPSAASSSASSAAPGAASASADPARAPSSAASAASLLQRDAATQQAENGAVTGPASTPVAGSGGLPRLNELAGVLQVPNVLRVDAGAPTPAGAASAAGAPSGDDRVMTLARAIDLGLQGNLDVRAAQHRAASFGETRNAARGALLPHLDLRLAVGRGRLESVQPYEELRRLDGSAVLSQPLVDEPARREFQRQGVLANEALIQLDGARSTAGLEIAGAYLQVVQARLTIELSQEYETLLAELLRVVTERAAGGGASGADRERVRGRVANARATIADARASLLVARRNLERLLGGPLDAISVGVPAGLAIPGGLETARNMALAQNADLLAARAEIEAADYERLGYAGRFLPRVAAELSHGRNVNAAGTESYYRETKAMIVVTVPFFAGGTDRAQARAAAERREEQWARSLNVERKLLQELDAAYVNLDAVGERYHAMREEIAANRVVVGAFKDQLTASNRSLLDVLDAYQHLYQSRLDLTQLLVGETQNQLRVAHLAGVLMGVVNNAAALTPGGGPAATTAR